MRAAYSLAKLGRRYERHLPLRHPRLRGRAPEAAHESPAWGTTVLTDRAEALSRAELLAKEFPDVWVYLHVEYIGEF